MKEEEQETEGKKGHRNYKKKTVGTKLITYTKKLKLKNQSRVWNFKNTMLKKRRKEEEEEKKQGQKCIKYIYMKFAEEEKNRVFFFFCKVIGYKSEN